jgi:xanthine dehydrogenase YagR molybdenum-binding subunit
MARRKSRAAPSTPTKRAAAALLRISYDSQNGDYELKSALDAAVVPNATHAPPDTHVGDFQSAFDAAPVKLDVTYTTPPHSHAMMEPHATLAVPDGDGLTLYTSNQGLNTAQSVIAATLGLPKQKVRVVSPFIGGGFGSKLEPQADAILAGLAARQLGRPVKLALTRRQVFQVTTHRSDTVQRLRLGADRDGRLVAIAHESWSDNTPGQSSYEGAANATRIAYAAPNRMTAHRLAALDLPVASAMRAPGEAVGLLALECAMDELAERLEFDPIERRIRNEPQRNPENNQPFSTRRVVDCMREGAGRFDWSKRNSKPGSVRDGRWLVGMGMSAAFRGSPLSPCQAEVLLSPDARATVRMSMTDIGTGTYTILSQIAADMLGLPLENVRVALGDTDFPPTPGSGGSHGAASSGSALYDACQNLRALLCARGGFSAQNAVFHDGCILSGNRSITLTQALGGEPLRAHGEIKPGVMQKRFTQESYGAHFAEVGVDMDTGEIRLRRMLGVFTAGRILNAKTARSQAIGGMTFGVGAALMEAVAIDSRHGQFVNRDLAEYHVAVHADIPAIDAIFLPELDETTDPLKSKGLGELGICGAGAAVANAVYNASGVRVRDYPLTLDKILSGIA